MTPEARRWANDEPSADAELLARFVESGLSEIEMKRETVSSTRAQATICPGKAKQAALRPQ